MKISEVFSDFIITFIVTFVVTVIVTFLYNIIVHSQSFIDWSASIRMAVIFGIIFPWLHIRERKRKNKLV